MKVDSESTEPVVAGDFTQQARYYAEARPGYPDALIESLLAQAEVRPGERVADIGAGTGISSRLLARHGLRVIAVEPNAAMRDHALQTDGVSWQHGSFEATGLEHGSVDWAVGAQAFHWADVERALPEMRRILRPGCPFTVFWNDRDTESSALLTETLRRIREIVPGYEERYRERDWTAELTATGDFDTVETLQLRHVVPMSQRRFMDLWRSHNRLNATAGRERFPQVLAALEDMLAHEPAELEVPCICRAWTAR